MYLRTALFAFVFALIAPQSRSFLISWVERAGDEIHAGAPMSYGVIGMMAVVLLISMGLLQNGRRRDAESPVVRYRKNGFQD